MYYKAARMGQLFGWVLVPKRATFSTPTKLNFKRVSCFDGFPNWHHPMALSLRSFLFQGLTFTLSSLSLNSLANCLSQSFISSLSKLGRRLQYPDILTSSPSFVCVERQYCCAAVEIYPKIFGGCKYFKTSWRVQIFQNYLEGKY